MLTPFDFLSKIPNFMALSLGLFSFPYKKFFEMCVWERRREKEGDKGRERENNQGREIGKHSVVNVKHYSLQILKFTGKIVFLLLWLEIKGIFGEHFRVGDLKPRISSSTP